MLAIVQMIFSKGKARPEHPAPPPPKEPRPMPFNRNMLYLIIGALVVATAVLGYQLYQDRKEPKGMQINVGPGGVSIEKK
jgi:hypothetical protein